MRLGRLRRSLGAWDDMGGSGLERAQPPSYQPHTPRPTPLLSPASSMHFRSRPF